MKMMKKIRIFVIAKTMLAGGLSYLSYKEAGIATASLLMMIYIQLEFFGFVMGKILYAQEVSDSRHEIIEEFIDMAISSAKEE